MNLHLKALITFLFICLPFFSIPALADNEIADPASNQETVTRELALQRVQQELGNVEKRWYGLTRVRWSYPQKLSAGFGAMLVEQPKDADCLTGCAIRGWHFEVEPGLYGIQGGIGWGSLVGETGRTKRLMHIVHFGWAVRGVVMRTWGDAHLDPRSQTLAGIEGSFSITRLNMSVGVLRTLSSEATGDWVISVGFGMGF